jgi:hypothetical protein
MSTRSFCSAFNTFKSIGDESVAASAKSPSPSPSQSPSLSPPPLPKSIAEHFDPYSPHHIPSPGAYEPRLNNQNKPHLPHDLSLDIVFDGGLQKMIVLSPADSPAAYFGAEDSPKPVARRRPLLMRRGSFRRNKVGKKLKESAGIV